VNNLEGLDRWARHYVIRCNIHQAQTNSGVVDFFAMLDDSGDTTRLDLSDNYLGRNGLRPLLDVISTWPACKTLSLRNTYLETRNVADIVRILGQHPGLQFLDLSHNPLYDTSGRYLLALVKKNRRIVQLNLEGTDIKESTLKKIANQVQKNLISQPVPEFVDLLDHLPPLPPSPTPFARRPALAPGVFELLTSMYCGEVDDNGGTPFSEERTRLLNAIATHGRLAVQLVTDLGFAAVGMLERLGYWLHGFDAIRQEVNRLMKEFAPLLDEDPILQDELGHLHDAINRCSSTEVTLYLWPMRSKCYSYRRLNPGITAAVDDSCLQLNATLLHRRDARQLTYMVDKIAYLDEEVTRVMVAWMTVDPVGPADAQLWDWSQLVQVFHEHFTEALHALEARAPILKELLPTLPVCVKDYILFLCFCDLNSAAPKDPRMTAPAAPSRPQLRGKKHDRLRYAADFLNVVQTRMGSPEEIAAFCEEWKEWLLIQNKDYIEASVEAVRDWSKQEQGDVGA